MKVECIVRLLLLLLCGLMRDLAPRVSDAFVSPPCAVRYRAPCPRALSRQSRVSARARRDHALGLRGAMQGANPNQIVRFQAADMEILRQVRGALLSGCAQPAPPGIFMLHPHHIPSPGGRNGFRDHHRLGVLRDRWRQAQPAGPEPAAADCCRVGRACSAVVGGACRARAPAQRTHAAQGVPPRSQRRGGAGAPPPPSTYVARYAPNPPPPQPSPEFTLPPLPPPPLPPPDEAGSGSTTR